jgi:hypothetical protein
MKKISLAVIAMMTICACGSKGEKTANLDGLTMDSIVKDTIVALTNDKNSPKCEIKLSLQYAKGENAEKINNALLRSGILMPDYLGLGNEKLDIKLAVDSFIGRYIDDYKNEYAKLYRIDKDFASSYNNVYNVKTSTESNEENVLTYIAECYTFGGGAHGISQTLVKNFNTKTGQMLTLEDYFVNGYKTRLTEIITEKLKEKFKTDDLESVGVFYGTKAYVPDNFIPYSDKITFIYCQDEIAAHAVGEIRIDIDKDEIKQLLKD